MIDPFEYQPPTEVTTPKYDAIRAAEKSFIREVNTVGDLMTLAGSNKAEDYATINTAAKALYDTIREHAPPSADRAAAERCSRLARMLANEAVSSGKGDWRRFFDRACDQATLARMQACAAIALNSPHA